MSLLLLLMGCGDVSITYDTLPCEDWDFENGESSFEHDTTGGDIVVWRTGVIQGCDDAFEPIIEGDGDIIRITEGWSSGGGDCELCMTPTVTVMDPRAGEYEIYWFDETSNVNAAWSETIDVP